MASVSLLLTGGKREAGRNAKKDGFSVGLSGGYSAAEK